MDIREEMLQTCRCLAAKGLVIGTGGNVSVRTRSGFLITPSGLDYALLVPRDIVELDFENTILSGGRTPSIEKNLHRKVLRARPDVSVIIHTHSTCATAVASCRTPLSPLTDNQVACFGGEIPIAENAPIGTDELAENVLLALGQGCAVLMANHGALCVGATLPDVLLKCELLENMANIYLLAKLAGGGVVLTADEVQREVEYLKNRYGQQ